jgi:hypothetical protein
LALSGKIVVEADIPGGDHGVDAEAAQQVTADAHEWASGVEGG